MTNTKNTKRALLASVMALLLCFSMLLSTTFAWFTDSVTSGNNIIQSGNLDIELEYWNGTDWADVKDASDILTNTLWEPGVTEVAYLRVANAGSLVLKYQFGINILNEIEGKNQKNETFKLSDYIMFGVVEGVSGKDNPYSTDDAGRTAAIAAVTDAKKISAGYTKASTMKPDEELYLALVVYMPTDTNDVANHNGTDIPQIDLGINVFATQVEADLETDSFGPDYDKDASAFVSSVDELKDAIANVKDGGTVYVNDGTYNINSQLTIPGKSVNIVGVGENAVIHMTDTRVNYNKIFYIYGSADGEDVTVNISNVTLTADIATKSDIWIRTDGPNGEKVNGNVTVNLDKVTCASIICDNNYVDGDTVDLKIANSNVKKVALDASPFNGNGLNTYTNLTYNATRIDSITISSLVEDLTHITINGVNPTATGEQQTLTYVDTAEELQSALDNAVDGDVIVLGADITGDVMATQKPDVKITVDGNGHEFNGVFTVNGKSAAYATAAITIQNVNFNAEGISKDASIRFGGDNSMRYVANVTVKDCTFTGNLADEKVGIKSYTGGDKNITITGCTATGMHSLAQLYVTEGVTITGCEIDNSKSGISVRSSTNVLISDCNINTTVYGIRADGGSCTQTIKNNTITAKQPIIVRKLTSAGYVLNLEGNTLTTTSTDGYQVILTTGDDDAAYVAPDAGNYTVNGQSELNFFK